MRRDAGPTLLGTVAGLLLFTAPALALDPALAITQYRHDVWNTRHGLPQSSVEAILQSRDGYLWFGTQEGLARFDGVRFVVYDMGTTAALKHNRVVALAEDRAGALWIGTEGGGLARLHRGAWTAYGAEEGLPNQRVRAIVEDTAGTLWVGTDEGLARLADGRFHAHGTADGLPSDAVRALAAAADGTLWIGTRRGLARARGGRIEAARLPGAPVGEILALWADADGTLWAGTRGGLLRVRGENVQALGPRDGIPRGPVLALWRDRSGSLWIGTEETGLVRLSGDRASPYTVRDGLANRNVLAIHEDAEGNVWVGTQDGGVTRMADVKFVTYTKQEGLAGDIVWPVLEDRAGNLWLGTGADGLSRLRDGVFRNYTTRDGLSNDSIQALAEDGQGVLWIGTRGGGLNRFKDGRFTTYTSQDGLPSDSVSALKASRDGALWVGTRGGGLARLQDGAFTVWDTHSGLPDDTVHFIHEDARGALWVATNGGGLAVLRDGAITTYTTRDGLPTDIVNTLHEDAQGTLWIGTYGGGLVRFRDGRFTAYTTAEGLYDNAIFHILEDDLGNLWMSCNKGVFRVSKRELEDLARGARKTLQPVAYGTADGMKHRECNGANQPAGWRTADGRLWFPTIQGVVSIHPARHATNRLPPPVVVEQVNTEEHRLPAQPSLEFAPGSESFEFHYTALSFSSPERVRFRYKLEGLDRDWVEVGSRRAAYYTRIPPGSYRFVVTAANEDGVWNEQGASVAVRLKPYFFTTGWFYAVSLAAVAVAGHGGYRLYSRRVKAREETLMRLVEERTRQLEHANRALARLSSLDGLTGVANRRAFDEAFEVEWRRCARAALPLSLVLVDIDHFKAFNDTYGHQGGDACLQRVAATLGRSAARAGELVARYGGEEFVVLLPGTPRAGATALADTLRARVEELAIAHSSSASAAVVTLSAGVAAAAPQEGGSPAGLLQAADRALYAAKRAGRNQVVEDGAPERRGGAP
jgi:diguanylate cyclase (GGDEF)-like protein